MPFNFKTLSVLVVEDTPPMRRLIVSVLDSMGIGKIFSAEDGAKGLEAFNKHNPDIVITDWHMEPINGLELTHDIRTNALSPNRMVPIIMMTGYSAFQRVAEARDAGVTEFLIKPFSASSLAARIAYIINKPRDFIDSTYYFGPDRRRKDTPGYKGPFRRADDPGNEDNQAFVVET